MSLPNLAVTSREYKPMLNADRRRQDEEEQRVTFKIIEDRYLKFHKHKRKSFIGESAEAYGPATVRVWEKGGVRLAFCGHDHNYQVSRNNGIHYVLTGGAGEGHTRELKGKPEAKNMAWSPKPHFVLCEYRAGRLTVTPYGELQAGELRPLSDVVDPQGQPFNLPPLTLA